MSNQFNNPSSHGSIKTLKVGSLCRVTLPLFKEKLALGAVRSFQVVYPPEQKPYLIECLTFRMRGHEEASGTKYVPTELFKLWEMKDPIKNYERFLLEEKVINEMEIAAIRNECKEKIESELAIGFATNPVVPLLLKYWPAVPTAPASKYDVVALTVVVELIAPVIAAPPA